MLDPQATAICPKCGQPLVRDAPRGMCAKCLFSAMLDSGPLHSPPQSTLTKAALPRVFGQYELLEEVARGGMGIVYRARQQQANRLVAVKVMAAGQFASPDFVKRFHTEAEAVASLNHPNIVPIYEVGDCDGQPFFSMRLLDGGSLAKRIADTSKPISDETAARWVARLAHAIHYAHQRGILHRDIKPGNVLLDAQGEPHLTDFGLAKLVEKDSTLTRTMAMLGTPSYMSPEQARGEAKHLTTAVDIYGLGAVFYELLSGQPPFAGGTTMETVRQVLDKEPRSPSALKPGVDRDLATVCLKCLAKKPAHRYGSAEALALDLERWLRHEPIMARPVSGLERLAKLIRRRPLISTFFAITLLAVAASVATLIRANIHISAARGNETVLRQQAERKTEESRQRLVRFSVGTGNRLVEAGESYAALLWFTEALRLENGDAAREDIHRRRYGALLRASPALAQLWFHDGFVETAEFSPEGDSVVSSSHDTTARVWDTRTGETRATIKLSRRVHGAYFAPDGKRVLTVAGGRLQFWDAATGEAAGPNLPTTAYDADNTGFSPDHRWLVVPTTRGVQFYDATNYTAGQLLATTNKVDLARFNPNGRFLVATMSRVLFVWDLKQSPPKCSFIPHPGGIRCVEFSHDGRAVATLNLRLLHVWDMPTAKPARPPIELNEDSFDCHFSSDDRWLAVASWDGAARVYHAHSGWLVGDAMHHRAGVKESIFSRDKQRLVTSSWDATARLWNPANGRPESPSLPHSGYVTSARFSPDEKQMLTASQDQTVRLWTLPQDNAARLCLRHDGEAIWTEFSPDGRLLLTCGFDKLACVWDVRTGKLLLSLKHDSAVEKGSFSPDGRFVATGTTNGAVCLWTVDGGQERRLVAHNRRVTRVEFSPDSRRIVSSSDDGSAIICNVADGQPVGAPLKHNDKIAYAAFSPDGRRVATASFDHSAQIWDADSGAPVGRRMEHVCEVYAAAFSPDGRILITGCADSTQLARAGQLWDATTGEPIGAPMPHTDGVLCVAFSPDGRFVATGGEDRVAVIWDAANGARRSPSLPHSMYVRRLAFSPDSRLLLTVSLDGTARVWESATGEPVTQALRQGGSLVCGAWSPDGREIATASTGGNVCVWDVSPVSASLASLQYQAEVLAAHRIEPNFGLVPLTAVEMQARWEAIRREAALR